MITINLLVLKCTTCQEILPAENFYRNNSHRHGRESQCKSCLSSHQRTYRHSHPWVKTWLNINRRCTGSTHPQYSGIRNMVTIADLKTIWNRDNADGLTHPSIDRINPQGNYEPSNIRYIELSRNIARAHTIRLEKGDQP